MIFACLLSLALFGGCKGAKTTGKELKDPRDGKTYKTVSIGTQTWMAENLNFATDSSYCYNNDPSNCDKYGRLYTWNDAIKACPSGWHLPDTTEWKNLYSIIMNKPSANMNVARHISDYAAFRSTQGWNNNGNGTDIHGFAALPAGGYGFNQFINLGVSTSFWSNTTFGIAKTSAFLTSLSIRGNHSFLTTAALNYAISVRCIKD